MSDQHGDGHWGFGARVSVTPSDEDLAARQLSYEEQRERDDEILFPGDYMHCKPFVITDPISSLTSKPAASGSPAVSSGGDNDYWLLHIAQPKRKELKPYTVECEDIIEAFEMTFQEGEAFKALWRKCNARLGNGKPGDTPLRNAEKVAHFGQRMLAIELLKG